jgi:hypothetical protein
VLTPPAHRAYVVPVATKGDFKLTPENQIMKTKRNANHKARILLEYSAKLDDAASLERDNYAKQFGANASPNRFPVSGGVCDHWPEFAKDAVLELVTEAQDARSESLTLWKAAGMRTHTWVAERVKVCGR